MMSISYFGFEFRQKCRWTGHWYCNWNDNVFPHWSWRAPSSHWSQHHKSQPSMQLHWPLFSSLRPRCIYWQQRSKSGRVLQTSFSFCQQISGCSWVQSYLSPALCTGTCYQGVICSLHHPAWKLLGPPDPLGSSRNCEGSFLWSRRICAALTRTPCCI